MSDVVNTVTDVNGQATVQNGGAQVVQQPVVQQPLQAQPIVLQTPQSGFTQEQVNSIVSGRVNALNQKITELTAQLDEKQKLADSYLTELTGLKNRDTATKAGVPAQFTDYAIFEAQKLAVNGKSFEDAMKEIVTSNASLFGVSNPSGQGACTTPNAQAPTGNAVNPTQTTPTGQQVMQPVAHGSTGTQVGGNPANTAGVDAEVDNFLKSRGLRR